MRIKEVGYLALLIAIVLAIAIGIVEVLGAVPEMTGWWLPVILLIGLVVGILNLATKDAVVFLITALTLVITAGVLSTALAGLGVAGPYLETILLYIVMIVGITAFISGLRTIYALSFK